MAHPNMYMAVPYSNIAIDNALRQEMSPFTKIQAFAEDIAIYSTGNYVNALQKNLQDSVEWMVQVSPTQTVAIEI